MQPGLDEVLKARIERAYKEKLHYEPDVVTLEVKELSRALYDTGMYGLTEGIKIGRTEGHMDCLAGAIILLLGFIIYNYFL